MKKKSKKSKDYISGFIHGINWMLVYSNIKELDVDWDDEDFDDGIKEAVKSLKEGR